MFVQSLSLSILKKSWTTKIARACKSIIKKLHEECTRNLTRNILNNLSDEYHLTILRAVQVMKKAVSNPLLEMFTDAVGMYKTTCCRELRFQR